MGFGYAFPGSSADMDLNLGWEQPQQQWTMSSTGYMTPMADVATSRWAQFPQSIPVSPVSATRNVPVHSTHGHGIARNVSTQPAWEGQWATPVAKPEPKSKVENLKDRKTHGARVVAAVDALALWNRLDEEHPTGPEDPTEGFSPATIDLARRGRVQVAMSVETTPSSAYAEWSSEMRTQEKHGRPEEELYEEYRIAVENYRRRRQSALQ